MSSAQDEPTTGTGDSATAPGRTPTTGAGTGTGTGTGTASSTSTSADVAPAGAGTTPAGASAAPVTPPASAASASAAPSRSAPAGTALAEERGGRAPTAGESAPPYVGRHVPRPAPGYDDAAPARDGTVNYAAAVSEGGGPSGAQLGFTALAAVMMMLSGVANFLEGLAAIIRGRYFVTLPSYAYNVSVHGWGWTHLIVGVVVFLAGVCLFMDMLWARVTGIVLASLSLLLNLVYIPYFPVWSIIVIAIDAFVIWALLSPRRQYA